MHNGIRTLHRRKKTNCQQSDTHRQNHYRSSGTTDYPGMDCLGCDFDDGHRSPLPLLTATGHGQTCSEKRSGAHSRGGTECERSVRWGPSSGKVPWSSLPRKASGSNSGTHGGTIRHPKQTVTGALTSPSQNHIECYRTTLIGPAAVLLVLTLPFLSIAQASALTSGSTQRVALSSSLPASCCPYAHHITPQRNT